MARAGRYGGGQFLVMEASSSASTTLSNSYAVEMLFVAGSCPDVKTPPAALARSSENEVAESSTLGDGHATQEPAVSPGPTPVWRNSETDAIVLGSRQPPPGTTWERIPPEDLLTFYAENHFILSACRERGTDAPWRFERIARKWLRSLQSYEQSKDGVDFVSVVRNIGVADVHVDEDGAVIGRCVRGTIVEEKRVTKIVCRNHIEENCRCCERRSVALGALPCADEEENVLAALRACWQSLNAFPYEVESNCNSCGRVQ